MRRFALVLALALASGAALAAEKYTFEPTHSQVNFTYMHLGLSQQTQQLRTVGGTLMLDAEDLTKSSVDVTIDMNSIDTGVAKFDEHLKSADFFDTAQFPTATFKSTAVEKAGDNKLKVAGDLTLHGVTRPVVLDVTVNKLGEHPMAKKPAAGFNATTTVKRSDFGLGGYVPAVGDEVAISIASEFLKAD
jgi:polyisoprenoid-binding protein YceI